MQQNDKETKEYFEQQADLQGDISFVITLQNGSEIWFKRYNRGREKFRGVEDSKLNFIKLQAEEFFSGL